MSVDRQRRRERRKILAASLMPAAIIGIPLALLLISELRSLGRLEDATSRLLTQTAVQAAEELAREIRPDRATAHTAALDAIPPAAIASGDLETVREALDGADPASPVLGTFLIGATAAGERESSLDSDVLVLFDHAGGGAVVTLPAALGSASAWPGSAARAGFRSDPVLDGAVAARVREVAAMGITTGCGFLRTADRRYLLVLRLSYSDTERPSPDRFIGYIVPVGELESRALPRLGARIRDSDWTFATDGPLEISIIDDRDEEIFRTGPSLRTGYVHEKSFPLLLLDDDHRITDPDGHEPLTTWTVRSGYPGTTATAIARSSTNQQRQILSLVALITVAGIVLSGRAAARELGLAGMKAEFVSSVSHDLKTPVASIQVLADVLKTATSMPPDKVRGYGNVIGTEARKLGNQIDSMLEFEKINTGGRMYNVDPIDLRAPLREAVGEHATQLKEAEFRTELRLPADRVAFVGNAEALNHAFANVVGNAIKYSGDDRFLRVEMRIVGSNAVIDVHDHGAGIPATERTKIFERFYRVRNDAETDPTGTGLGLPIARHVIRAHGGRISVAGGAGGGSVFSMELPLARADTVTSSATDR